MTSRSTMPVIVLLAAGEGNRFGGAKQLADVGGQPMVRRVANMLVDTDVPVIVVTGAYADEVEAAIDDLPLNVVRCDDWQLGMGQSLAAGSRELVRMFPTASAALICLADQPLMSTATLRRMLERHAQAPEHILAAEDKGVYGPPVLFPSDCFTALATSSGQHGARALLKQHAARVEAFVVHEAIDVDTLEDLQKVQAWLRSDDQT